TDGILDGDCSLREALAYANANPGLDRIGFEITDTHGRDPGTRVATIHLVAALPGLVDDGITVAGYTQPGASPHTLATPAERSDAVIRVVIDGGGALTRGLGFFGTNATSRGLAFGNVGYVGVEFGGGSGNALEGSFVGLHPGGTPNANLTHGIVVRG